MCAERKGRGCLGADVGGQKLSDQEGEGGHLDPPCRLSLASVPSKANPLSVPGAAK